MGCDIHLYTEKKGNNGKWLCVDHFKLTQFYDEPLEHADSYEHIPIFDGRDYALFATLANVRNNGNITPISEPGGLPDGLSSFVKKEADDWGWDAHSHSWFTARELFMHKANSPNSETGYLVDSIKQRMCEEFRIWSFYSAEEKEEMLWNNSDDFRIVFWFDN